MEALGQTKIIAVDKTGTLTRNEMVLQRVYVDGKIFEITGNGYEPKGEIVFEGKVIDPLNHLELLFSGKIAAFCANARSSFIKETDSWKIIGDPTEAAMLVFSEKVGFHHNVLEDESPKIFELPFDYSRKYHATVHSVGDNNFLTVVGAPENVMELCKNIWHPASSSPDGRDGVLLLSEDRRKELKAVFHKLAKGGFRVMAYAMNSGVERSINPLAPPPLTFVGFFGMSDALRSEVREAMKKVKDAGMRVVMITGDHSLTAEAIAKEADIWRQGDIVLTGEDVDRVSSEELARKLVHASVFARVSPAHKMRIIEAFRSRGEVVAMTGDGVNDAPSLVAADLGVAMGKIGTEVAKEASDIVLLDDNFAGIVSAAEEGRGIYKTIKKVIFISFLHEYGGSISDYRRACFRIPATSGRRANYLAQLCYRWFSQCRACYGAQGEWAHARKV
ncbi:MAG: HAD-IC family P-type ATPase [Candidatus Vogelbacteria bacterium]|nr:HAD-IC family P-type ATPase [Candidatus Vogelbacteria bacterium]